MANELSFIPTQPFNNHHWGVVLAGGDGTRLQHFLKTEYGLDRPKQYCSLIGGTSMLRSTIDRAAQLIPKSRLLTVIGRHHLSYAMDDLTDRDPDTVITQPFNCETGPGILLPLLHIQQRDPNAVVGLFPSDHFIVEEDLFMEHVKAAYSLASKLPEFLVTLGVSPNSLQPGYGWIEKGDLLGQEGDINLYCIKVFWEKPNKELTEYLYAKGCLWNTLTVVGTVETFMQLFKEYTPELYVPFKKIASVLGTAQETQVAEEVFRTLPHINFSSAILEHIPHRLSVLPVKGVYWSDWGDEQRIRTDLASAARYVDTIQQRPRLQIIQTTRPQLKLVTPESLSPESFKPETMR